MKGNGVNIPEELSWEVNIMEEKRKDTQQKEKEVDQKKAAPSTISPTYTFPYKSIPPFPTEEEFYVSVENEHGALPLNLEKGSFLHGVHYLGALTIVYYAK